MLAGNIVVHLLEDKLRKRNKPPSAMSVPQAVQFDEDTIDLLAEKMSADGFGAKYGI